MKNVLICALLPLFIFPTGNTEHYLITGTYTDGKSEGIYVHRFNSLTGEAKQVSYVKTSNPSYLVVSPDERFVYAIHENAASGNGGEISSFAFDKKTGTLTSINKSPTGGDHPCYVEIDKTGNWVFAGNYSSGSLSVFPVNKSTGVIGAAETHIKHSGSGGNPERQEKPHVHCTYISPDNRFLYVPDLGIDKVQIYSFDEMTGKLKAAEQPFVKSEPGGGPRHITFHPSEKFAYVVEELSGQVLAFEVAGGKLTQVQRVSTLPPGANGFAGSADIHVSPDGKYLYASNRGDYNNIVIYQIDQATGKLKVVDFQPTLGKGPRNFNLDPTGKYLLVGNQNSDEIVVFSRDAETGKLSDSGNRIAVGKPVCLKWINVD